MGESEDLLFHPFIISQRNWNMIKDEEMELRRSVVPARRGASLEEARFGYRSGSSTEAIVHCPRRGHVFESFVNSQ